MDTSKKLISDSLNSLPGRLLIPVVIVVFVLMAGHVVVMSMKTITDMKLALKLKADSTTTLLGVLGRKYLIENNVEVLDSIVRAASTDPDITYSAFLTNDGSVVTKEHRITDSKEIFRLERTISDDQGLKIGKIVVGFRQDRINEVFWAFVFLGVVSIVLTTTLVSMAIFIITRNILRPLLESLKRSSAI